MKINLCKERLSAGEVPIGHMILEFGTRGMAQMLESAKLDFVIIDSEHSAFNVSQIVDLVAWFKATPIAPFVRIPEGSPLSPNRPDT